MSYRKQQTDEDALSKAMGKMQIQDMDQSDDYVYVMIFLYCPCQITFFLIDIQKIHYTFAIMILIFNRQYIPLDPNTPKIQKHPASKIFGAEGGAQPQTSQMQGGGDRATIASKVSFQSLKSKPQFPHNV